MPHQVRACPGCHRLDRVQKLSSIVKAETATAHSSGRIVGRFGGLGRSGGLGGTGVGFSAATESDGDEISALGEVLAPPAEPIFDDRWGVGSFLLLALVLLTGLYALFAAPGLHCAADPPAAPARTACWDGQGNLVLASDGVTGDPAAFTQECQAGLILLPTGLFAGLVALRVLGGRRRRRRFRAACEDWEREYDLWASLYYCYRCDGVFAPGMTQSLVPAEELPELLARVEA